MTYIQSPSHRAMLAALAFSAAGGNTAEANPDAELLALGREWQKHAAELDRIEDLKTDAQEAYEHPDEPEALFRQARDARLFPGFEGTYFDYRKDRRWYGDRESVSKIALTYLSWSVDETKARCEEIIGAYNEWTAEVKRRREALDLSTLEADTERLNKENNLLRNQIARMPANTVQGIALKARMAAWCHSGTPSGLAEYVLKNLSTGAAADDDIAMAVVCDLMALVKIDA